MNILRMMNPIMPYAWGSKTFIQNLLGDKSSLGKPQAELWMGAHPKSSSQIRNGEVLADLNYIIAEDPSDFLGRGIAGAYSDHLPFLLKVLAAERPLSVQVHPNQKQAADGFARENKLGIPYDAPNRNYKDAFHKPELLVALTEFQVLCGFRDYYDLTRLCDILLPKIKLTELDDFLIHQDPEHLKKLYAKLLNLKDKDKFLASYLKNIREFKTISKQERLIKKWTLELNKLYPKDIGILSPLLMNIVVLQPWTGLYLEPGVLHSYLYGTGIEIMANSDNVLRGSLTLKHFDIEEFIKVADFTGKTVLPLRTVKVGISEYFYETPAKEFALSYIKHNRIKETVLSHSKSPEIIVCCEGSFTIENCSQFLSLEKGQSLFVPYEVEGYTISGKGLIFRARCNVK